MSDPASNVVQLFPPDSVLDDAWTALVAAQDHLEQLALAGERARDTFAWRGATDAHAIARDAWNEAFKHDRRSYRIARL